MRVTLPMPMIGPLLPSHIAQHLSLVAFQRLIHLFICVQGTAQHFSLSDFPLSLEFGKLDIQDLLLALVLLCLSDAVRVTANAGVCEDVVQTFAFFRGLYV